MAVVTYTDHGVEKQFEGVGNGPIDAVQRGLEEELGINIKVLDYSEHALTSGSGAQAASYIHMMDQDRKRVTYGVGISSNITRASLRAASSAPSTAYMETTDRFLTFTYPFLWTGSSPQKLPVPFYA